MKPKPLSSLNHFTVPVLIARSSIQTGAARSRRSFGATTAGAGTRRHRARPPGLYAHQNTSVGAPRSGSDQSAADRVARELDAIAHPELLEDVRAVTLDGLLGD